MIDLNEFKEVWFSNTRKQTAKHFGCSESKVYKIVKENKLFKRNLDLPSQLTQRQYELVIGSLLGDGCLMKPRRGKSNFVEAHGEKQRDYTYWKNEILKPFSREVISSGSRKRLFPNGKSSNTTCYQMYTSYHTLFSELEKRWYLRDDNGEHVLKSGRRIKCIPSDLKLTPFSFAVWFMDDGRNNTFHRNAAISTDGFSLEECQRLCSLVNDKFNFNCYERLTSGGQYEIYIPAKSYFDCMDLIKSQGIQCECMNYKWDISKCKWKQFTQEKIDAIFTLREDGKTYKQIARELGTSIDYACKIFNHQKHRRSA